MGNTFDTVNQLHTQTAADGASWRQGFIDEVGTLAANLRRPVSAAWARSVVHGRMRDPRFLGFLDRFHHMNPGATPPEAQRRFLSAEQAQLLDAQDDPSWSLPAYPSDEYSDPTLWRQSYHAINRTPPYDSQYFHDLIRRDLTTAVSQRTVLVRFLRRTLSHLVPDEPLRASCGASDMSGDRRDWLSGRDETFRFDPVGVVGTRHLGGLVVSEYKSDIFNSIVAGPDDTRRVVGYDRVDPELPANKAWNLACATPEEILSGGWVELHDRLMRADVPTSWLGFRLADLAKRADIRRAVAEEGQADIVSEILCWYEGSAETRRRKFKHMFGDLLKPGGLGISAEFARRVSDNAYLMPNPKWSELNVFVWHRERLHRVLSFTDGRCHQVRVLRELGELARGGPYEHEVDQLLA